MGESISESVRKALSVLHGLELDINYHKGVNSPFKVRGLLAGGCARDVYFGKQPKDWDIVFPRDLSVAQVTRSLTDNGVWDWKVFPFYGTGPTDRIKFCVKFTFEGQQFDVLSYDVDHPMQALGHFDFNINQFFIANNGRSVFMGQHLDCLEVIRGDHSTERLHKMQDKWLAFHKEGLL